VNLYVLLALVVGVAPVASEKPVLGVHWTLQKFGCQEL